MITNPEHELALGGLTIAAKDPVKHPGGFTLQTYSADADFGNPEPIEISIATELEDGDRVEVTRHGNRELFYRVQVSADDAEGLALGEAALAAVVSRRTELTWRPPSQFGELTVYDVETSHLEWLFDDMDELRVIRVFGLLVEGHPFGRPPGPIMIPATGAGSGAGSTRVTLAEPSTWSATVGGSEAPVTTAPPAGTGVDVPVLRTNLVPNPRFVDFAGWTAGTSGTIVRTTPFGGPVTLERPYFSPGALRAVSAGPLPVVTAGQSHTASIRLTSPTNIAAGGRLQVRWINGSSEIGTVQSAAMPANPSGLFSVTGTAPAGTTHARVWLELSGTTPAGSGVSRITASEPMLERAASAGTYFDGTTPIAGGVAYRWSGTPNLSASEARSVGPIVLTRTESVNYIGTPYLHVDYSCPAEYASSLVVAAGGIGLEPVADPSALGGNRWRRVYAFGAPGSVPSLRFSLGSGAWMAPPTLRISGLVRASDAVYFTGTARQLARSFPVHGTARTPGTLHIAHQSGLGDSVLLYTGADDGSGYQPPSRQFKTAGAADEADPDAASGAATQIQTTAFRVDVPIAQVPAGKYRVMGRIRRSVVGSNAFTLTATTTGTTAPTVSWTSGDVLLLNTYTIVDLGATMLPTADVLPGGSGLVRVTVRASSGGGTVYLDDLYLLNVTTGAVVVIDWLGASKHLWVDAPTVDHPFPALYAGDSADRAGAVSVAASARVWQPSVWYPGQVNVFSVCASPNAAVDATYFPRFLHNAHRITPPEAA